MANRTSPFAFDWWIIQKRFIYLMIVFLVLCVTAAGAALYVWKYGNPLKNVGIRTKAPSGARFISFEGDVHTEQQPEGTTNVVETPKTQSKLGEQTGATFGVNPEGTEEIRITTGVVETTNRAGEKASFHGGDYVSVNPSGTISRPQKLLEVPLPAVPRDLQKIFIGANGSASVPLKWLRPQSGTAAYYRVEVATSPFFVADGKVIERDQLASTEFGASDLRPGVYFWRVRATAASGQVSDWSDPQKFMVATRGSGSQVAVSNLAAELLGGNLYLIRGQADPGTTIHVGGREALVPTGGSFQIQITASAGAREVMVDAQDNQGNSSQYKLQLA